MMKILYFAWIRERIGLEEEVRDIPSHVTTVAELIDFLKTQGDNYKSAFADMEFVRTAVNQTHVKQDHPLKEDDEVAFFPPVTGG